MMPVFGYGCAVFLQTDIVNFQRQGWRAEEILAGLATVLPRNVFLHVAGLGLAALGTRFILQGGTRNNCARGQGAGRFLRQFPRRGESAGDCCSPALRRIGSDRRGHRSDSLWRKGHFTTFIGMDAVRQITYRTTHSEDTRCHFCKNACQRTFLDVQSEDVQGEDVRSEEDVQAGFAAGSAPPSFPTKVPLQPREQRVIVATCEKGAVEDLATMRGIKANLDATKAANPNLVEMAAREVWRSRYPKASPIQFPPAPGAPLPAIASPS